MAGCCTIRSRMTVWVLAVASMVLLTVMLASYGKAKQRLEADMEAKAVFLADSAAKQVDAELGLLQGVVHGMAIAVETQRLAMSFDSIRRLQTAALKENPGIHGVCIAFEPNLAPIQVTELAPWEYRSDQKFVYTDLAGPSNAHTREDWYSLPKHLERPVWSEPYEFEGVLMVTYSVPIYLHNENEKIFTGVVTCDLSLDGLEQIIKELPLGKDGYGLILSRNGTYIVHPLRDIVLNETVFSVAEQRKDPELRATGQKMISGEPGIMPFLSFLSGDLSWLAYTPLRSGDWIIAAIISRDEMNEAIARLNRLQVSIGIIGLLLLSFAVGIVARSITLPISKLKTAASILAAGDLDAELPVAVGEDEVAFLTRAFSHMRDNLKQYIAELKETTIAQERMRSELAIAREIQMGLVPKTFPPFPNRKDLDLYAVFEPARQVGGDFYDFFLLDDGKMVIAIGDVSGKGVPAALFMAVTRSFLRSAFKSQSDPAAVLTSVNDELIEGNDSCMFVTLFCAIFDFESGNLHYANAGHNSPVVRHVDGKVEWVEGRRATIVGAMPNQKYVSDDYLLPDGSALILYTDGVTEAMDPHRELYGEEQMINCLGLKDADGSCQHMAYYMLSDIRRHAQDAEQSDDITILILKHWKADSQKKKIDDAPNLIAVELTNTLDSMQKALDEIETRLQNQRAAKRLCSTVRLALEELLTNTINHGYDDNQEHTIKIEIATGLPLNLSITDDGKEFNPATDAPDALIEGDVDERSVGGLGLHLIKSMGIKIDHEYRHGNNLTRLVFPEK